MISQKNKIEIKFGKPVQGWLPTFFRHKDFELELAISNVPLDPMVQLCDALVEINKGINNPGRVVWHLEPYCYYLQLKRAENAYRVIISESDQFDGPAKITTEISGSFDELILPLYRALKKFWSMTYEPPDWDKLDSDRIKELTDLINKARN